MIHNDKRLIDGDQLWDYRCDSFIKNHNGKHIIFLGDSFAAGDGLEKEDVWCHKVYQKISKTEATSGYFNLGSSGSSISEAVDQFFKYCSIYGNPDIVFFITTEFHRDERYGLSGTDNLKSFVYRMYFYLEQYCKSNKIKLYSFSWLKSINEVENRPKESYYISHDGSIHKRPSWTSQGYNHEIEYDNNILLQFETFYDYHKEEMLKKVFEFDLKSKTKEKSLWALDGAHPGTSFHDFYADFIFNKYQKDNKI